MTVPCILPLLEQNCKSHTMTLPSVLVADPPWFIGQAFKTTAASKHYKLMSDQELLQFKLPPLADDCLIFLWRLASRPEIAFQLMKAWGFGYKTELVWVKTTKPFAEPGVGVLPSARIAFGNGHYVRAAHETCLIGRRGRANIASHSVRSVIVAPRGKHSAKPDAFYKAVEELHPGPYVELFARTKRPGWEQYGDEI
jgi:N6-adenosine-specific RNA methylase IME4